MKIVMRVKLLPDACQASALGATVRAVNEAANWVSTVTFERGVPREFELRKHTYAELKASGLGAQAAQHVIKKVRDAYTTLKANLRAGNLGRPGSKRRVKATACSTCDNASHNVGSKGEAVWTAGRESRVPATP